GGNQWLVEVAAETDTEYLALFGGNVTSATNDLENLLNQMDLKYQTYVDIVFEVTTIVIRESDSYSSNSIDGRLNEFISNWNNAPETSIERDIVQMFSGVNFSGGVIGLAPLGVVCNDSYSYSIVETRYTTNLIYRTSLSVHEMGHNWNAGHCDGDSDCRIMCSSNGGCGTPTSFGSYAIGAITSWRNSVSCDLLLGDSLDIPWIDDFPSSSVNTTNWIHNNGAFPGTGASNEVSGTRALNLDCTGSNEFANDEIRSNTFNLGSYDEAYVSYWTQQRGPEDGEALVVEYMNTGGDWVELERHISDGTTQNDFYYHEHHLTANSQLHNGFRLRFRTEVNESNDDWYIDDVSVSPDPGSGTPPPENDDCENAIALSNGTTEYATLGATTDGPEVPVGCSSTSGPAFNNDIWYIYTADCTGFVSIAACDADFDNRMAVYPLEASCPTTSTSISACSDDDCGNGATLSFLALDGQSFRVRVGSPDSESGSGTLVVGCDPIGDPPVNDECSNPTIVYDGSTDFNTNISSESGPQAPIGCSTSNGPDVFNDVWFAYTAECTGIVTVGTCDADFDSRILLYQGTDCPSESTSVLACEDDTCGDDAQVTSVVLEGSTILIRVGSPQSDEGEGTLVIDCEPFDAPCPSDLNGDDAIDGADLGLMLSQWGADGSADLNDDGIVDGADLGLLLAAWGEC
ncbi:MAG: M12 family metallo-peptidase, partial [Phycisphaerales bacterium]|nr:M12 family metallo-peptidase [Phycisphaerales bacterium]